MSELKRSKKQGENKDQKHERTRDQTIDERQNLDRKGVHNEKQAPDATITISNARALANRPANRPRALSCSLYLSGMRSLSKVSAVGATTLLSLGLAFAAPNAAGKWKGKIQLDPSSMNLPANMPPEAKKQVETSLATVKKIIINLDLRANGTFTVHVTGAPGEKSDQKETGKWTQKGNTLTLTPDKKDKTGKSQAQTLTISADGKKLTLTPPASSGANGKVIFTK